MDINGIDVKELRSSIESVENDPIAAAINTQYRLSNFRSLNFAADLYLIQGAVQG